MEFAEFILAHDGDDLGRLALARKRYVSVVEDFDLALTTLEVRRKLRSKVPEWYAVPSLRYPLRLSGEQCSSSETARYKAGVAFFAAGTSRDTFSAQNMLCEDPWNMAQEEKGAKCVMRRPIRLADLTGGMGVDTWAFAQLFDEVLYNEMRPELANATSFNLKELGLHNVQVRNGVLVPSAASGPSAPGSFCVTNAPSAMVGSSAVAGASALAGSERVSPASTGVSSMVDPSASASASVLTGSERMTVEELLDGFRPDVIFLDPARRAADGRKVFRLEDCEPDVLQLLPELFQACPKLLLKLSPMADITLVCKQLGCVKEVHVVAAEGECKELLLLLERDYAGPCRLLVRENGATLDVDFVREGSAGPLQSGTTVQTREGLLGLVRECSADPVQGTFERGTIIGTGLGPGTVAGLVMFLFEPGKALLKAGAFDLPCHYGLEKLGKHTHLYVGTAIPEALKPFGKVFQILEMMPLNKRSIKEISNKYPLAEVTARNIPLTSEQLRAKLGVRSGGTVHLFGVHIDALDGHFILCVN